MVGLRKLRQFQELGHQIVLIVGDWTAQIGDPSGASATRKMLTAEEVKINAETYMKQFFKIVDKQKTEVRWQSEWFGKFNLADVVRLTSKPWRSSWLEDFAKRFADGKPIAITEFRFTRLCGPMTRWQFGRMLSSAASTRSSTCWWGVNCRHDRAETTTSVYDALQWDRRREKMK
jgi:hypothetical protein